jgi:hypothetical protein
LISLEVKLVTFPLKNAIPPPIEWPDVIRHYTWTVRGLIILVSLINSQKLPSFKRGTATVSYEARASLSGNQICLL